MPKVNVIAKKDCLPFFKIGDKLTIVPILYEEDTLIRNELHGIFIDGKMVKIWELGDVKSRYKNAEIKKISEKLYAPKGSYKDSLIVLENGVEYPSSLVRSYDGYFQKVK